MGKISIIGGGIGGLCAAIGLQRNGIQAHVYEKVPKIEGLGAGIILSINAAKALRQIGVYNQIIIEGNPLKTMQIVDEKARTIGKTDLEELARKYNDTNISIHRAALHRILLNHLESGTLHTDKIFTSVKQTPDKVKVSFQDGTTTEGSALLAFDGIHSAVRQHLLPETRLRYSGYTCWRSVIDYVPHFGSLHALESWGKGKRFGIVPLKGGKLYWFATANAAKNDSKMKSLSAEGLRDLYSDFHTPVEEILSMSRDKEIIWNDISDLHSISRYTFGRVVLAGDAAHATTPNMGQGAGMAIEDAAVLARLIAEQDVVAALDNFQAMRIKRTQNIVDKSYKLGSIAQLENTLLRTLRNTIFKMIPQSLQQKQLEEIYRVDL